MKLLKLSLFAFAISLGLLGSSYLVAQQLPEAEKYSFPESIGRHYAKVTGAIDIGELVEFQNTIPIANGSVDIKTIEIETTSKNVSLAYTDGTEIEVYSSGPANGSGHPLNIDTSRGQTLRISSNENLNNSSQKLWFVFNSTGKSKSTKNDLRILIPESISSVTIQSESGDLLFHKGRSQRPRELDVHFKSTSGDTRFHSAEETRFQIGNLKIDTVSGDLRGSSPFRNLDFNSVSGDIRLTELRGVEKIAMKTVSGDFRIETAEPVDASISFESTSGDMKIANQNGGEQKLKPTRGSPVKTVLGKGTAQIEVVSVSGDFKIEVEGSEEESE